MCFVACLYSYWAKIQLGMKFSTIFLNISIVYTVINCGEIPIYQTVSVNI